MQSGCWISIMDVDDLFKQIGELGRQQWKYVIILSCLRLNMGLHFFQYTFVRQDFAPTECHTTDGAMRRFTTNSTADVCAVENNCTSFTFDTNKHSNIVSEWSLLCSQ